MEVLESSPHRLKLRHRPLYEWVAGGIMAVLSGSWLVMGLLFQPTSARLTCDRPLPTQMNCDLTQQAPLRSLGKQRLFELQSAEVRTQRRSRGRSSRQIWLSTPYGDKRFLARGEVSDSNAIATRINQYIQNPQQKVLVVQQYALVDATFFLGFAMIALIGGIWATLRPVVTCSFYERLNKVIIERRQWNGQQQVIEHPLHSVLTAEVEEKQGRQGKIYRPVLVLVAMERLPITQSFISEKAAREVVYYIQKFIPSKK